MKIIVANWKMNLGFKEIDDWLDGLYKFCAEKFDELENYSLIVCPPSIYLDYLDSELIEDGFKFLKEIAERDNRKIEDFSPSEINEYVIQGRPIRLGAQNCHFETSGAFTGELSAKMLRNVGCEYVILGHSERRIQQNEDNQLIEKKVRAVVEAGLIPIVCVGENEIVREEKSYFEFLRQQILCSLPCDIKIPRLLIAYEPIWSIGTGNPASVGQINEIMNFISRIFANELAGIVDRLELLYGGSVTPSNSAKILEIEKVDGLLVGKASLDVNSFLNLCPLLNEGLQEMQQSEDLADNVNQQEGEKSTNLQENQIQNSILSESMDGSFAKKMENRQMDNGNGGEYKLSREARKIILSE